MHVTAAAPTGPVAPPHLQPLPDQVAPVPLQAPVGPHAPVAIIHEAPHLPCLVCNNEKVGVCVCPWQGVLCMYE